jgi:hypothetical protein
MTMPTMIRSAAEPAKATTRRASAVASRLV